MTSLALCKAYTIVSGISASLYRLCKLTAGWLRSLAYLAPQAHFACPDAATWRRCLDAVCIYHSAAGLFLCRPLQWVGRSTLGCFKNVSLQKAWEVPLPYSVLSRGILLVSPLCRPHVPELVYLHLLIYVLAARTALTACSKEEEQVCSQRTIFCSWSFARRPACCP